MFSLLFCCLRAGLCSVSQFNSLTVLLVYRDNMCLLLLSHRPADKISPSNPRWWPESVCRQRITACGMQAPVPRWADGTLFDLPADISVWARCLQTSSHVFFFFCSCFPLDTIEFVLLQGRLFPKMQKKVSASLSTLPFPDNESPASSGDMCVSTPMHGSTYMYILSYPVPLWFKIATLCQSLLSHQRQVGLFWKVRGLFVLIFL